MSEKLIAIHSSLALSDADKIITHALKLRQSYGLLPLAVVILDSGGNMVAQQYMA